MYHETMSIDLGDKDSQICQIILTVQWNPNDTRKGSATHQQQKSHRRAASVLRVVAGVKTSY